KRRISMKKKIKGLFTLLVTCVLFAGILSACSTNKENNENGKQNINAKTNDKADTNDNTAKNEKTKNLNGTITMSGSTSMEKLANVAAEAFMLEYPGVT